ncbi:luciferin 4-monooxygenase-like isoform X3 [Amblyomma americanum]
MDKEGNTSGSCNGTIENGIVKPALRGMDIPKVDFGTYMRDSWLQYGDKTAVVDDMSGESCTFSELDRQCRSVAAGMLSLGFKPGDVAAFISTNTLDLVVALFGAIFAGAKVTFIKTNLTGREVGNLFNKLRPTMVFCDSDNTEKVREQREILTSVKAFVSFDECDDMVSLATLKNHPDQIQRPEPRDPEDVLFIFFTSGTTGHPKPALITHRNYVAIMFGFKSEDSMFHEVSVYLALLPMAHPMGVLVSSTLLIFGAKTITLRTMAIDRLLAAAQKYKNVMLLLYPTYVRYLTEAPVPRTLDLSEVRAILIGGSTTPTKHLKELSLMFPHANVVCGYGLTEVVAAAAYCRRPCKDATCVGPPVPDVEMKVVDVTTNEILGPRECGEICIRGPTVFKAYMDMPEATAKAFDEDGFFCTGDTGYYTEEGHFHVAGRIKDIIKCMDQQVAPAELETLLLSHPDVREVVVAGVPHPKFGEAARAFVVLRDGTSQDEATKKSLEAYIEGLVANYKQLHGGIEFLDKLPVTDTGKALRREVCEAYLKRIAAATAN